MRGRQRRKFRSSWWLRPYRLADGTLLKPSIGRHRPRTRHVPDCKAKAGAARPREAELDDDSSALTARCLPYALPIVTPAFAIAIFIADSLPPSMSPSTRSRSHQGPRTRTSGPRTETLQPLSSAYCSTLIGAYRPRMRPQGRRRECYQIERHATSSASMKRSRFCRASRGA